MHSARAQRKHRPLLLGVLGKTFTAGRVVLILLNMRLGPSPIVRARPVKRDLFFPLGNRVQSHLAVGLAENGIGHQKAWNSPPRVISAQLLKAREKSIASVWSEIPFHNRASQITCYIGRSGKKEIVAVTVSVYFEQFPSVRTDPLMRLHPAIHQHLAFGLELLV